MIAFLIKRVAQAIIVMFVISLVSFSIQDNLGDPLRELVGQSVSEAERQDLRDEMGLNDPFLVQYARFAKNALQGDLGTSYFFKEPPLQNIPTGCAFNPRCDYVLDVCRRELPGFTRSGGCQVACHMVAQMKLEEEAAVHALEVK